MDNLIDVSSLMGIQFELNLNFVLVDMYRRIKRGILNHGIGHFVMQIRYLREFSSSFVTYKFGVLGHHS